MSINYNVMMRPGLVEKGLDLRGRLMKAFFYSDLSGAELSRRTGIPVSTINSYMNPDRGGPDRASYETIKKIAMALGCPEILLGSDAMDYLCARRTAEMLGMVENLKAHH